MTHPVVVVGAGPVGLALLLALRRSGVEAVAVDRDECPSNYPKGRVVSTRSMELLRRWGVAAEVEKMSLPDTWTERIVVLGTLAGTEVCRVESPPEQAPASPQHRVLCTQDHLERVLADRVEARWPEAVRWRSEAVAVHEDGTVQLAGGDTLQARYVVLADGVRGLGAGTSVPGAGTRRRVLSQVSFRFRADLRPLVGHRPSFVTYLIGGRFPAALLVVDGAEDWILMTVADRRSEPADFPPERLRAILADVLGVPAADPLVERADLDRPRLWDVGYRVADRFVHGRIIRAGDAAHEVPPTGTVGLNLGLSDVDSLAWRLVAELNGWAGPDLLAGYDTERRLIARSTARWTRTCLNAAPNLAVAASRGDRAGIAAGAGHLAEYIDHPGIDLGPVLPPLKPDPAAFIGDGRPGSRAPHLPLGPGESTLDHYGDVPVLLTGERTAPGWAAEEAARQAVPIRVLPLPESTGWHRAHGVGPDGAVLVRPDGYVWWRGDPADRPAFPAALRSLAGR